MASLWPRVWKVCLVYVWKDNPSEKQWKSWLTRFIPNHQHVLYFQCLILRLSLNVAWDQCSQYISVRLITPFLDFNLQYLVFKNYFEHFEMGFLVKKKNCEQLIVILNCFSFEERSLILTGIVSWQSFPPASQVKLVPSQNNLKLNSSSCCAIL